MTSISVNIMAVSLAYKILGAAKYNKLEDSDKIKLWKISRILKPFAVQYDEELKDACNTFKPDDCFEQNLAKALQYEIIKLQGLKQELPMTEEEYSEFIKTFKTYKNTVEKALKEEIEKNIEITFEPLTEEAFGKLLSSNDWTIGQAESIEFIIN